MTDSNIQFSLMEGLTYDDILILPGHSEVLPHETHLKTRLTRNITLNIPLISAAMDTVTESDTAISMARNGGLGIIHKNMSIQSQAQEVKIVKKSENGMIIDPIVANPNQTVGELKALMKKHNISGLPVLRDTSLVGIITGRDIRFEKRDDALVKDVMTKEVVTTQEGTPIGDAVEILHKHRIEKLPVLRSEDGSLVGMFTIKDIEHTRRSPLSSKDSSGQLLVGAAIGIGGDSLERAESLLREGADVLVLDSAHGHSQKVLDFARQIKAEFRSYDFELIGGNVATAAGAEALIEAGVDGVKVGIGPGSICTTRIIAGIGVPQFTAVMNCSAVARKYGVPVIADGGIKFSGDIVKGLAAGASTAMIGSLFAGTEEAPGELVIYQGKSYKTYRGMGSMGAMSKGSKDRYFQSKVSSEQKLVPEGIEGRVPYKGSMDDNIYQLVGGIRAAMGYIGAKNVTELQEKSQFIKITSAGLRESHAHDVFVSREAPNYKMD